MLVCCRLSISFFTFANTVALVVGLHTVKRYLFLAFLRFGGFCGKEIGRQIVVVLTRFLLDIMCYCIGFALSRKRFVGDFPTRNRLVAFGFLGQSWTLIAAHLHLSFQA